MRNELARLGIAVLAVSLAIASAQQQRPVCQMSEALVSSVDVHLQDWDNQVDIALNETFNCSTYLEFIYMSRDRIKQQLDYVRGNFTAEDDLFRARGEEGISTTWSMTHMSKASSLVTAHLHIHGLLAWKRTGCLSEHLQLLFLMSLQRLKILSHTSLRHLWIVFQGTAELFRDGVGRWLTDVVELFEADLQTMESVMSSWQPPPEEMEAFSKTLPEAQVAEAAAAIAARPLRPGPPLPAFNVREPDNVGLSTLEVLRRGSFEEWPARKALLRALLRYVLPRDGHIGDMCAGSGAAAEFLNSTGLMTTYAFDASPNIRLLSKGAVDHAALHAGDMKLWRQFDMLLCLSASDDYGDVMERWAQVWMNVDALVTKGAILSCGTGEVRKQALASAAQHAPTLQFDEALSEQLDVAVGDGQGNACVFWRQG